MESQEGGWVGLFSSCIPIGDSTVFWLEGQCEVLCPFALRQEGHERTCMCVHMCVCKRKPVQVGARLEREPWSKPAWYSVGSEPAALVSHPLFTASPLWSCLNS